MRSGGDLSDNMRTRAPLNGRGLDLAALTALAIAFAAALASLRAPSFALSLVVLGGMALHAAGLVFRRAGPDGHPQSGPGAAASDDTMSEIRDWHIGHAHLLGALKMQASDETTRRLAAEAEESAHGALTLLQRLSELPAGSDANLDLPEIPVHEAISAAIQETRTMALSRGIKVRSVRSTLKVKTDPALAAALIKAMLVHAMVAAKGTKVLIGVRRVQSQARFEVWSMAENAGQTASTGGSPNIAARMADIMGYRLVARSKSARARGIAAVADRGAPQPSAPH